MTVVIDNTTPNPSVDFDLDFTGYLSGTVYESDGQTPVVSATVNVSAAGQHFVSTLTDENGEYFFYLSQPGTYQVDANTESALFQPRKDLNVTAGSQISGVDLLPGARTVSGTLVDRTGAAIAGAGIVVSSLSEAAVTPASLTATTAADGRFQVTGLFPGEYRVASDSSNHGRIAQKVVVGDDDPATILLEAPDQALLQGNVRSFASGQLVADTLISVVHVSDPSLKTWAISRSDGSFEIAGLPAGDYELIAIAEGHQALVRSIELSTGTQQQDLRLEASTSRIEGVVTSNDMSLPGAYVGAADAQGRLLAATVTNAEGAYVLDSLPPGDYFVTVIAAEYHVPDGVNISVANNQVLPNINFSLAPAALGNAALETIAAPAGSRFAASSKPGIGGWFTGVLNSIKGFKRSDGQPTPDDIQGKLDNPSCRHQATEASKWVRMAERRFKDLKEVAGYTSSLSAVVGNWGLAAAKLAVAAGKVAEVVLAIRGRAAAAGLSSFWTRAESMIGQANKLASASDTASKAINKEKAAPADLLSQINSLGGFVIERLKEISKASEQQVLRDFRYINLDGHIDKVVQQMRVTRFLKGLEILSKALDALAKTREAWIEAGDAYRFAVSQGERYLRAEDAYFNATAEARFAVSELDKCNEENPPSSIKPPGSTGGGGSSDISIRSSFDPNDKIGPDAFGPSGFRTPGVFGYEIQFENDPDLGATLPAQEVFVTDALDADLDLTTLEFTEFGFSNFEFEVPVAGLSFYQTTIDLRPHGIDLLVPVTLEVNFNTRVLSATFRSLDPLTGLLPDDIDAGFLPVNDKQLHNGEGFFRYRVQPLDNLPTGTEIRNQAQIVFDVNEPIVTPETIHTIDVGPPSSQVNPLPARSGRQFTVSWSGSDDQLGSGIRTYDVYVSRDSGPFQHWQTTSETSATITGQPGENLAFYCLATDNVGHQPIQPVTVQSSTFVAEFPRWNHESEFDVNNDSFLSPIDALLVINHLNQTGGRSTELDDPVAPFYDTSKDNFTSPIDALMVINALNRLSSGGEGEIAGDGDKTLFGQASPRITSSELHQLAESRSPSMPLQDVRDRETNIAWDDQQPNVTLSGRPIETSTERRDASSFAFEADRFFEECEGLPSLDDLVTELLQSPRK